MRQTAMEPIAVGTTVDIKRTDGRIHEAIISSVNAPNKSVTVEWLEKGETKGKEIDVATLIAVNPGLGDFESSSTPPPANTAAKRNGEVLEPADDNRMDDDEPIISVKSTNRPHVRRIQSTAEPPSHRRSRSQTSLEAASEEDINDGLLSAAQMADCELSVDDLFASATAAKRTNLRKSDEVTQSHNVIPSAMSNSHSAVRKPNVIRGLAAKSQRNLNHATTSNAAHRSLSSTNLMGPPVTYRSQLSQPMQRNASSSLLNHRGSRTGMSRTTTNGTADEENRRPTNDALSKTVIANPTGRKSVTVQEIERLEKQREERRAQTEAQRARRDEMKNHDPNDKNWEFRTMIREYRAGVECRPLRATDRVEDRRITVCVRKRPLNKKENTRHEPDVVTIPTKDRLVVHQPQVKVDLTKYLENQQFRFDYAFDVGADNQLVYKFTAQPLVRTVFEGGFATCFAYGQTGSGKTHTMGGDFNGKVQDCSKGIYALTAKDIFRNMEKREFKKEDLYVAVSFFEIYSGKVFDLLNHKNKLRVLEDGHKEVNVVGLVERDCDSEKDVLELIAIGTEVRTAGQTSANNNSSRSHAVLQIMLRRRANDRLFGKFSLIDLAGNERGVDTNSSDRQTRMEGAEINKSLLALKECIRAMDKNSAHLPFRASKLTLVLRDSFLGVNSRTCMITMISPGLNSCEHTLNSLRYADRVKELNAANEGLPSTNYDDDVEMEEDRRGDEDSDLQLVQSRNMADISDDLRSYQLAYNHINDSEDRTLNEHQALIDSYESAVKQLKKLMKSTEKVDYDMDAYVKEAKGIVKQLPDPTIFAEELDKFQFHIHAEEKIAQKSTTNKRR